MRVLSVDKMLEIYMLALLVEDFQDAAPGYTVDYLCDAAELREMLFFWLGGQYNGQYLKVSLQDEARDHGQGMYFQLEIQDDSFLPVIFSVHLLRSGEFSITLQKLRREAGFRP